MYQWLPYIVPVGILVIALWAGWQLFRGASVETVWSSEPTHIKNWRAIVFGVVAASFSAVLLLSYRIDAANRQLIETASVIGSTESIRVISEFINAREASYRTHPFLGEVLTSQFDRFSAAVGAAKNGLYNVSIQQLPVVAISIIEKTNRTVRATSYVNDDEWWNTSWGRAYLDENRRAVKERNVKIERVFILRTEQDLQTKRALLKANADAGVKVSYVLASDLQEPFSEDVILIDDQVAGVLNLNGQSARSVQFSANKDFLDRVRGVLRIAFVQAKPYPPTKGNLP